MKNDPIKEKMKKVANESYSAFIDGVEKAWPSPSENYSWFRMKEALANEFLKESRIHKKLEVIDFGCGEGTDIFTLNILKSNDRRVLFTGVDFSEKVIENANRVAKKRGFENCKFITADADTLDFGKKFDFLISSEVLEHTSNPLVYLKNANKQLRIRGKIFLTTPNKSHIFKRIFKLLPRRFQKGVKEDQDWCYKRHGIDTKGLFHSHVSTQRSNTLYELLKKSGFKIRKKIRSPLIYGGRWIDKRPLLFSFLLFLDGILPKSFLIDIGWDLITVAEKIHEI